MPSHVTIGHQLSINVTPDFAVPPSVVNVDNADHVPLKGKKIKMSTGNV